MFCHVFIITMQIWIFVYLWNKWCFNLWVSETWWFQIMVCHLESTSVFFLFIGVLWAHVSQYKICYNISNFCSFRRVCSLDKKSKASNPPWKSRFMIYRCVRELWNQLGHLLFCILFITKPLRYRDDYQPSSYCQNGYRDSNYQRVHFVGNDI